MSLESVLEHARDYITRFREGAVDTLESEALGAGAAVAERIIAEPTETPLQTPEEAAEVVRQRQRAAGLRREAAAPAQEAPAPEVAPRVEVTRRDTERRR